VVPRSTVPLGPDGPHGRAMKLTKRIKINQARKSKRSRRGYLLNRKQQDWRRYLLPCHDDFLDGLPGWMTISVDVASGFNSDGDYSAEVAMT
jgi:hypothetical protein